MTSLTSDENTSTTSLPPDKEGSPPEQAGHQKQQAAKSMVMLQKNGKEMLEALLQAS